MTPAEVAPASDVLDSLVKTSEAVTTEVPDKPAETPQPLREKTQVKKDILDQLVDPGTSKKASPEKTQTGDEDHA